MDDDDDDVNDDDEDDDVSFSTQGRVKKRVWLFGLLK